MALTKKIADFVENLRYDDIPADAVELIKMLFCDFLGVAMAGKNYEGPQVLRDYILEHGGAPDSSVPGYRFKTSPPLSALLCGTMGHVLDYDDAALSMSGHAAVILCPVIWALGDKYNISGEKAIEAFLAGFEGGSVAAKYSKSGRSGPLIWHMTKALGIIASTLTAAKIMDLTSEQIRAALGIAASSAGGLIENFGTMMKSFHAGSAAHEGIMAATLAKKGFTSNMDIIEIDRGFRRLFSSESEQQEEPFIDMLESGQWDITSPTGGVVFKLYPSCGGTHKPIHALIYLAEKENINPDEVESVVVKAPGWVFTIAHITEPKTGLEGKFSIEYTAALALIERSVKMEHFTNEKLRQLEPLMKKVRREADEETDTRGNTPCTVTVTMKDGKVFTKSAGPEERFPGNPMSWEVLLKKYRDCMAGHFSQPDIAKSEDILCRLESLDRFESLVSVFTDNPLD